MILHRYCPDHDPDRSLCGISLAGAPDVSGDEDAAAETMPWCVVCFDLGEIACEDACLGARSEATS